MSEKDLYPEIENWLNNYLSGKYVGYQVETTHGSATRKLENVLREFGLNFSDAILLNVKVDVVGILRNQKKEELVFVEVKEKALTLKDLGQLWGYTQLINPLESFLISPQGLGILSELYNTLGRRDLFVYGQKSEREMKAAQWLQSEKSIDYLTMIPKS
ncbi:MAG: hypothetical protein QXV17_11355 [Candidatus Micrarchaeaceae archaeon]